MGFFFRFIVFFIVVLNVTFCGLQLALLRRRKPRPRALGIAVCVWTALMIGIFFVQVMAPVSARPFLREWLYFPIATEMIWNLLFIQLLTLGGLITAFILGRWRRVPPEAPPLAPADESRRRFIYLLACGAAPATALSMGVHGTLTRHDLRVRNFQVPIAGLPPELEGFTIAHVSDLHSGIFCGPERLKIISSATNDLNAQLIVITGDIINDHMQEFPAALTAIQRLRAPCGIYLCEGNHDLIPGPGLVAEACNGNNLPLLSDQAATLAVNGRRLILGGLPWMKEGTPGLVERLYPERREGDVRILLAHHPNLFDVAQSADLVLAGHTHGGQIMVADSVGLGPLFFRYWSGLYRRGNTTLIVSNGCGDWFPCRIGAPAEIGLLRLTKAV